MNRMKYIFLTIVTMISLLCSCALEETFEPSDIPEVTQEYPGYFILSGGSYRTKVTYSGDAMSSYFQDGELLGAFALDQDMVPLTGRPINACYKVVVTEETHLETGEKIRILEPNSENDDLRKDGEGIPAYYMFYYPYDSSVQSLDDLKQYEHSVAINQNSREAFQTSDLLWDITSPAQDITGTAEYVWVEMDHAMAQIIVEIESDLIQEGTVPTLLNIPTTVSPLNLVKSSLNAMTEDMAASNSYVLGDGKGDINMWEFGYATSGNQMFRAAVPANHLISYGSAILQLTAPDGTVKKYRSNKSFDLKPGMTYRMVLVSERELITPDDVGDDDTWVYDVLDPETNEPVGLLCREYLRFQPGKGIVDKDVITGTEYTGGTEPTKFISSQAWVFYKMEGGVPDLDSGHVLRFIYDLRTNLEADKQITSCWPEPHMNYYMGGLFTPAHGHLWVDSNGQGITAVDGETYTVNYQSLTTYHVEHGMHGGVVTWDGTNNKISWFSMPTDEVKAGYDIITNEIAANQGHIAIPEEGEPYLCYRPLSNDSPHKIGVLSPHYLVDRRVSKNRTVEERLYPLVKVGYNQFWMSLSLRASTQVDGTPLTNYNKVGSYGVSLPENNEDINPGYMFAYKKLTNTETVDGNTYTYYDPWNDMTLETREQYKVSGMYNFLAITEGAGMLPRSTYAYASYHIPMVSDIYTMHNYLGWKSAAKITTRRVRAKNGQNGYSETEYEALMNGRYTADGYNNYSANICGFDLRAEGYYFKNYGDMSEVGAYARMLLLGEDSDDPNSLWAFSLPNWSVFFDDFISDPNGLPSNNVIVKLEGVSADGATCFAPLRFFMKFRGQADSDPVINVTSTSLSKGLRTKSSAEPVKSRDIYVSLEPVEE